MEVNIKVLSDNPLKLTYRKTNKLRGHQKPKVMISNASDRKSSWRTPKNSHGFREMESVASEHRKEMGSTTC
jgi:hypothetical protein